MDLSTKPNHKSFLFLLIVFLLLTISACKNSGETTYTVDKKLSAAIPASLGKLSLTGGGTLNAYLTLDGDTSNRKIMTIDTANDSASITLKNLSAGPHTIMISYVYSFSGQDYLLAMAAKSIDLSASNNSLGFLPGEYDLDSFDYDNDGINNATEFKNGTAAGTPGDTTVPVFASARKLHIIENQINTGYKVLATDNNPVTYSLLSGMDESLFTIDSNTGQLSFKNKPDFQQPADANKDNIYLLGILASDGSNPITTTIQINLTRMLVVKAQPRSVEVNWNANNPSLTYNLYYSTDAGFDPANYSSYSNGTLLTSVMPPLKINGLENGTDYYFRLEIINGTQKQLSKEKTARPNPLSFNDAISALTTGSDSTVYIGGNFTNVGIITGGAGIFNMQTNQLDYGSFPFVNGIVTSVIADGNGGWYIGGLFSQVGNLTRNNLAHILADGSIDPSWNPSSDGTIHTMALAGNTLYIGGNFTTLGGQARSDLAAINTNGTVSSWNPGTDGAVYALSVSGNTIYIGGSFSTLAGQARSNIAAIDINGSISDWNPGADSAVLALAVSGSSIYVGGTFSTLGGLTRNNLAAVNADGTVESWNPVVRHIRGASRIYTLLISGSTIYVGGRFDSLGFQPRNNIGAINIDGTVSSWNPDANNNVESMAVSGNTIYIGGSFTTLGGQPHNRLAAIDTSGNIIKLNMGADNSVRALAISGNRIYLGGYFNMLDIQIRNRLAAIKPDGSLADWNPGANGSVSTLAISGTTIYAGGYFTSISGQTRNYLAAINSDGTLSDWNPGAGGGAFTSTRVEALAVSGSTIYVGGRFNLIAGRTRINLAAINTDGTLSGWNPGADNTVSALAVSGTTIYAGGSFNRLGGQFVNYIGAISSNGTSINWNPNIKGSGSTYVATISISGTAVYIGGLFDTVDSSTRNNLAAVNTDGTLSSWNPGANSSVETLAVSGSTIYAGGSFTTLGGQTRNYLAAINSDGTLSNWNPNISSDLGFTYIKSISLSGTTVYTGGSFDTVGNSTRNNLAAIDIDGTLK